MNQDSIFKDCADLSRLPYYELNDQGKVVAKKDEIGRVVDFHTHFGLMFLFGPRLNLLKRTGEAQYFFPYRGNPLDLNEYSASSFTAESQKTCTWECIRAGWTDKGFMGTQTIPHMLDDMDRIGVTHSLVLAVDWPTGLSSNSEVYLKYIPDQPT